MPTVEIKINTGIEYSPTDEVDSAVKLHNFTVGSDGSLYKLPALKNLKNTEHKVLLPGVTPEVNVVWPYRLLDIKKFQTSATQETVPFPTPLTTPEYDFHSMNMFRRFIYLTTASYGVINVNYDNKRIKNSDLPSEQGKFGEFEYEVFKFETSGDLTQVDLSSLNPKISVDFNAQYDAQGEPTQNMRAVFPAQHMFESKTTSGYGLLMQPRNMIHCSMDATSNNPDIKPLSLGEKPDIKRIKNDIARGTVLMGNRMIFYSVVDNKIIVSLENNFRELLQDPLKTDEPFSITPPEEIQDITDFNGNMITFTPTGIERWLFSDDQNTVIQRDPTMHYEHRIRYEGSFVKADRDLYYYTDDFQVYRLNSNLTIDPIFKGNLPAYKPLENYLNKDQDLPMSYFKMMGYRFVSVGPWLYNIDSNTWSTYSYDGWKTPDGTYPSSQWMWESDTNKRVISTAYDSLICTYSTICTPLTYKEMQDKKVFDDAAPSLIEGKHQWGEVAFFTTRMYQDEQMFGLDGVMVYVRGGMLEEGAKIWLKVLRGADLGDFDEDDESTYGVESSYQPMDASILEEDQREHVGRFNWEGMNLKTDRFRLQFVTKEKQGIVIQSVLANITTPGDSQAFLVNNQKTPQQTQQQQQ